MVVHMVGIRYMRMRVPQRVVTMPMAVRTRRHWDMHMLVVTIIMAVRVLVLRHVVPMLMSVGFRQVQHYPRKHQRAARRHQPTGRLVAQYHGQRCTYEGANAKTEPVRAAPKARCAIR